MYKRLMNAVHTAEKWLLIALIAASVTVAFMQVFFRFVLMRPLSWSEELTRYLFVWMGMIGTSVALQNDSHFRMDILVLLVPEQVKRVLSVVWDLIIFGFCCVMVYYGGIMLKNSLHQLSPALHISMAIPYASVPIAGLLMILSFIEKYTTGKEDSKR